MENASESSTKKLKVDEVVDLSEFINDVKVINHLRENRVFWSQVEHDGQTAIVKIEKKEFELENGEQTNLLSGITDMKNVMHNNEYNTFSANLAGEQSQVKVEIIYPASEWHIKKFSASKGFILVRETPELYKEFMLPFIESIPENRIQWVRDCLSGTKEADTCIFNDKDPESGFGLWPNYKWDRSDINAFDCLMIVQDVKLRTLRDLTAKHIPLLQRMLKQSLETVEKAFGIKEEQLRIFVHYPPSFYHFHVHVVHASYFVQGHGAFVGRARLLEDVIFNLSLKSDYYQEKPLVTEMKIGTFLHEKYQAFCETKKE